MKPKWKIIYYETDDGQCPVMNFIDSRNKRNQAKIFSLFDYLEKMGPNLPRPYSDLLEDGFHELRIKLIGEQIRILYFFYRRKHIVLTHVFTKTTQKVPKEEIQKAKYYRDDFMSRFNNNDLKEQDNENI